MAQTYTPTLTADWDLQIGTDGSLRMSKGAYAIAQTIACACKNFRGGLYFFKDSGVAWFSEALGQEYRRSLIIARLRETAQAVEGVKTVDEIAIDDLDIKTRTIHGEIFFTTEGGENGKCVI